MATISTKLHAALKRVTRSGSFCVSGNATAPLLGPELAGIGPIGLSSMRPPGETVSTSVVVF